MIKSALIFYNLILLATASMCVSNDAPSVNKQSAGNTYMNPVYPSSMPDPTVIKAPDGFFYLYATEDVKNTPILRSADLVTWNLIGTAFTAETRPSFEPKGNMGS